MVRPSSYSPEVRERAVRLVHVQQGEHRFAVGGDLFGC